jgi:hypothetical protein
MTRYYKATDGTFTVFRSSKARVYASAWIQTARPNPTRPHAFGFRQTARAPYPVEEISKAEYDDLKLAQKQRLGGNLTYTSPRDAWVRNDGLFEVKARIVGL